MTVETECSGQVAGASANLLILALARGKSFIHSWGAEKGNQRRTKLLPEKRGEVNVGVDLLGKRRYQRVQALEKEDNHISISGIAAQMFYKKIN